MVGSGNNGMGRSICGLYGLFGRGMPLWRYVTLPVLKSSSRLWFVLGSMNLANTLFNTGSALFKKN